MTFPLDPDSADKIARVVESVLFFVAGTGLAPGEQVIAGSAILAGLVLVNGVDEQEAKALVAEMLHMGSIVVDPGDGH